MFAALTLWALLQHPAKYDRPRAEPVRPYHTTPLVRR